MAAAAQDNPRTPFGVHPCREYSTPGVAKNAPPGATFLEPSGLANAGGVLGH
jgi:hypothetical protein